jgi:Flp pilus assembly protein TadD
LLIFAAVGLAIFWRSFLAENYGQVALYLALLTGATIFVSWPQRNPSLWALDAYNSGWQALEAGNLPLAEKKLQLALAYVPANAETNFAFGNLKHAEGDDQAATNFYLTTLRYDGNHRGAFNNLGVVALASHNYDEAERWFRRAIQVEPRNGKAHFLLARTLLENGRRDEAQREIEIAIGLNPQQPEFKQLQQQITSAP